MTSCDNQMFCSAVKGMGEKVNKGLKREVPFAMFLALLGVVMGCIGLKWRLDCFRLRCRE